MSVISDIAAENYLKSIVKVCSAQDKDTLGTGEVAKLLSVTPGTATMMIKKLEKDGYLEYKSYRGCKLTAKGKQYGLSIVRRHRLLETFLIKLFDMSDREIHDEAEQLEHSVSEKLIDLIDEYLNYPERDPHGAPIPRKNQNTYAPEIALASAPENELCTITRLAGTASQNRYCANLGLTEGRRVLVAEKRAELGSALLRLDSCAEIECPLILLDIIHIEENAPIDKKRYLTAGNTLPH
ncbi:MAG: metal-dependent transcriptional regulator [Treponema sp.]